ISCLPTNVITEDCNGDGALNFDEFSLPVEGTGCEAGARDRNNNNEAVFLSPAQLAQGRTFQAALDYASSSEGTTTAAMVGLVVTGGVTQGVSPNIVRLNKAEYTCSDSLNISILDGAQDSSTSLLPVQVTLVSKRPDNTIVDTESGWAYTAAAGAPSIRFTSQLAATLDEANQTPSNNNQIVSVVDGGTITVTYADTIDPDGAGPLSVPAAATATATVRCAPAVNILNIARRGTNARFGVTGGCDPRPRFDPRAIAFGLIPGTGGAITGDLFLDKNEDLIYSVGFLNTELGDALVDVTATLKVCGLPPFTAPATGLTEADIKAGTCPTTSAIEIKNNTVRLGTIQTGKAQTASFPIHVANNVIFPQQVAMVFEVSADRNGLTASSQTVFFHVLDTDTWSRADEDPAVSGVSYYSTDFPTGGREVRLYAGEAISTFPNLGPETFVFQDMVTAPATNSMLGTADGSGTIPNNWPWDFDPDDEGFLARRRFDSKPEGNADLTSNVWQYNNTGECGFQSNGPTDTDGQGGNGGMWHTGFAQSMAGTPPTQSGFDLGCEDFSVPGGADPRREQVLDVISSPRFFRVHQNKDGNGFEYQVEFLRLAMNIQEDLPDGNVIMALELDPDTKTPSPVDALDFGWLASDQGTEGFLQGSSQIPYFVFNPNDPHEVTSVEAVLGTLNETPDADPLAPSASQNIRKIHGPGSAGSFFDPNDPNKAPARQYGEIPGVFGSGRGMGVPARRGAGGLPVRNFDSALIELGGGSLEDTFGPNETRSPLQVFPISATNSEVLANRRDSYQVNVIAFLRESEDPLVPAAESYGYGVDDVVVEWREQHPIADRTPCSNPSTWATRSVCSNDNTVACTTDADCGLGTCNLDAPLGQPSANPAKTSGCADISWDRVSILDPETALTLQVIDRNAQFGPDGTAGTGDEQAIDGLCGDLNGLPEVTVNVNAPGIDQQGEVFCLEETAPNT
ncbi:MAG: hypothetical protein ACE5ID_08250, partial [Acidobacteriota bacterium]